jgi:hypothetical protein
VTVGKNTVKLTLMDMSEQQDEVATMSYITDSVFLICFSMKHGSSDTLERVKKEWIPLVQKACPNPHIILLATQCSSLSLSSITVFQQVLDLWDYCRDNYENNLKISSLLQVDAKKDVKSVNQLFDYIIRLPFVPRKYFTGVESDKQMMIKNMLSIWSKEVENVYKDLDKNKPNVNVPLTVYDPAPGFWFNRVQKTINHVEELAKYCNAYNNNNKALDDTLTKLKELSSSTKSYVEEMERLPALFIQRQKQRDSARIEAEQSKRNSNPPIAPLQFCDVCGHPKKDETDRLLKVLGKLYHKRCFACDSCGIKMERVGLKFYELDKKPVCLTCKKESMNE